MGVSSTARLPSLGAQSIPPLFSHLQHSSNAKVVARWSITIRSFRAVPVPTNAWPSPNQYDSNFSLTSLDNDSSSSNGQNAASTSTSSAAAGGSTFGSGGGAGSSASGAPPLTKPRTMWQVQLSDHPGVVFVVVEDTGRASRAKVWRDWELSTKKWRKQKRREIAARRTKEEQTESDKQQMQGEVVGDTGSEEKKVGKIENEGSGVPMDEDAPASLDAQADAKTDVVSTESQLPSGPSADRQRSGAPAPAGEATEQEPIEPAGPKPKLRLPSHTRYTVSAITSSMSAMLSGLNLPPPHGAPVGTAGPGAWVPRGAAVSIEGLVLEINSQSLNALPGISPALASLSNTEDAAAGSGSGGVDWRVRVGSVVGGGRRSAGAIVEAEFLPASTISPTSKFMNDFLLSLFPAGLVPAQPSASAAAPGMPNVNGMRGNAGASQAGSTTAVPGVNNASSATNGSIAGTVIGATASGFSYIIGGGAGATPPNRNLNLPVVSDQLWEEVVPRSGEGWVRRISKRSRKMALAARALRRQRKNAAESSSGQNGRTADVQDAQTDAFGWHTFGSDDEAETKATAPTNGHTPDEDDGSLFTSDSEVEATLDSSTSAVARAGGLTGTAVTMQQGDQGEDDDDDDDDRPLGAPAWSSSNRPAATAANPNVVPPTVAAAPSTAKKEHTVQLIFQGLQSDADDTESTEDGWSGIERGRRIAFQYVQMLRAEGII
ncbi:hypothetical protein PHBOTO_001956 [Pseudozyma hubeiensis]|nr:hypothetical protein PHBOTO_001956 [Pseudozyma hubeiensis]